MLYYGGHILKTENIGKGIISMLRENSVKENWKRNTETGYKLCN
jgi:hypothetical protein